MKSLAWGITLGVIALIVLAWCLIVADPIAPDPGPTNCYTSKISCPERVG